MSHVRMFVASFTSICYSLKHVCSLKNGCKQCQPIGFLSQMTSAFYMDSVQSTVDHSFYSAIMSFSFGAFFFYLLFRDTVDSHEHVLVICQKFMQLGENKAFCDIKIIFSRIIWINTHCLFCLSL